MYIVCRNPATGTGDRRPASGENPKRILIFCLQLTAESGTACRLFPILPCGGLNDEILCFVRTPPIPPASFAYMKASVQIIEHPFLYNYTFFRHQNLKHTYQASYPFL